jgi:hypothetical protein
MTTHLFASILFVFWITCLVSDAENGNSIATDPHALSPSELFAMDPVHWTRMEKFSLSARDLARTRQRQVLLDIFKSLRMNSAISRPLHNWFTEWPSIIGDCCSFTGVECNTNGLITHLMLTNLRLEGKIPSTVNHLSELVQLRLDCNSLSGSLPTNLATLSKLRCPSMQESRRNLISPEAPAAPTVYPTIGIPSIPTSSLEPLITPSRAPATSTMSLPLLVSTQPSGMQSLWPMQPSPSPTLVANPIPSNSPTENPNLASIGTLSVILPRAATGGSQKRGIIAGSVTSVLFIGFVIGLFLKLRLRRRIAKGPGCSASFASSEGFDEISFEPGGLFSIEEKNSTDIDERSVVTTAASCSSILKPGRFSTSLDSKEEEVKRGRRVHFDGEDNDDDSWTTEEEQAKQIQSTREEARVAAVATPSTIRDRDGWVSWIMNPVFDARTWCGTPEPISTFSINGEDLLDVPDSPSTQSSVNSGTPIFPQSSGTSSEVFLGWETSLQHETTPKHRWRPLLGIVRRYNDETMDGTVAYSEPAPEYFLEAGTARHVGIDDTAAGEPPTARPEPWALPSQPSSALASAVSEETYHVVEDLPRTPGYGNAAISNAGQNMVEI